MIQESDYLQHLDLLHEQNWPAGVPREPAYPFGERPLTDYLRLWAQKQPDKAAIVFYGTQLTFGQLDELSNRFANLLLDSGVARGDRVAVFLPNCPQFLIAFYGILKIGAVHVPVNPMFKEHELLYELNDSGAQVLVALDQLMDTVRRVRPGSALREVFVTSIREMLPDTPTLPLPASLDLPPVVCGDARHLMTELAQASAQAPDVAVSLDELAALNYTGGTTGMPKGCMHTQRAMLYTAATSASMAIGLADDDIGIGVNPVFWIAGENACVIMPVFRGVTVVMLARWDPVAWMTAVQRYQVTFATLVVDAAVEVMDHPDAGRHQLRSLRSMRVSSFVKKLGIGYRERWRALTGTTMIEAAWGMTETHTSDTFTRGMQDADYDLTVQPIFVGLPVPGTQIKICDFETHEIKPLGTEGELCCRSPSVLKAYWNNPAATADVLRDGWLHSGDIGMLDEHGYLHFLGRRKEMLKVKGMSVFPAEIEAILGMHPSVRGSGVIGRPDSSRGEVPVAFVLIDDQHKGQVTPESLAQWCAERMATYKVPELRFVDQLPMTTTGKVKKGELSGLL